MGKWEDIIWEEKEYIGVVTPAIPMYGVYYEDGKIFKVQISEYSEKKIKTRGGKLP
ncbi:MAG: hypothetical protein U9O41_06340 [Candidatus Aerophobetes bacterium]|nr:hypothetical protein [Candidatus Aerophobetes bacterium]